MPYKQCSICSKDFYVKPSHLKLGYGKFCSKECKNKAQRKGHLIICDICGQESWKQPKALKNSKSGKFFCSKTCQTKWRNKYYSGELHANWCGGESTYQKIMAENKIKPFCRMCKEKDKRVLIIHHKDCNRKNNVISNLIWLCRNCHYLVHGYKVNIEK